MELPKQAFAALSAVPCWLREELEIANKTFSADRVQVVVFTPEHLEDPLARPSGFARFFPTRSSRVAAKTTFLHETMNRHFGTENHGIIAKRIVEDPAFGIVLSGNELPQGSAGEPLRGLICAPDDESVFDSASTRGLSFRGRERIKRAFFRHEIGHLVGKQEKVPSVDHGGNALAQEVLSHMRACRANEREADLFAINSLLSGGQRADAMLFLAFRTVKALSDLDPAYFTSLAMAKALGKGVPEGDIDDLDTCAAYELLYRSDREEHMLKHDLIEEHRCSLGRGSKDILRIDHAYLKRLSTERETVEGGKVYGRAENRKTLVERIERIGWIFSHRRNYLRPETAVLAEIALESAKVFGLHPVQHRKPTLPSGSQASINRASVSLGVHPQPC